MATVFLMTPAAWHRIAEEGGNTERFHTLASRFLLTALFFLAVGVSGDVYVVVLKVLDSPGAALGASAAAIVLLGGLWFVLPAATRSRLSAKSRSRSPASA